jgi:hypothetical protein
MCVVTSAAVRSWVLRGFNYTFSPNIGVDVLNRFDQDQLRNKLPYA